LKTLQDCEIWIEKGRFPGVEENPTTKTGTITLVGYHFWGYRSSKVEEAEKKMIFCYLFKLEIKKPRNNSFNKTTESLSPTNGTLLNDLIVPIKRDCY